MSKILYQKKGEELERLGEFPAHLVKGLSEGEYSTLLEAPDVELPETLKAGTMMELEIDPNEVVSAVDVRYFIYKINFYKPIWTEIDREKWKNGEKIGIEFRVPEHERFSMIYRIVDWIGNWSRVKVIRRKIDG
ncbi:MAG: hypothetical protein NC114_10540 [Ruminococcus flavefaciens]|nr:hypothetical protein [Ruminococcus flavefaciens]